MRAAMKRYIAVGAAALPLTAVADGCNVDGSGLAFGRISRSAPESLEAIGHITIRCDANVTWIRVRLGAGRSGRAGQREMTAGEHRLRYNLYQDASRGLIFGDDSPGAPGLVVTLSNPGTALAIPVFAVIEAGQLPGVGTYSDDITVIIDF